MEEKDIADNKVMAILAYLWILFLIPLFAAKESKFARFHANQGIILFIASIVVGIASAILGLIPIVGAIVGWLLSICLFVFFILGIVNAVQGKAKELPFIGGIKILK
ncbi:MAG: hypothetical protein IJU75_04670 [Clostridia bacterium]|nr:hypothetical protein [Clostridia bacterium]